MIVVYYIYYKNTPPRNFNSLNPHKPEKTRPGVRRCRWHEVLLQCQNGAFAMGTSSRVGPNGAERTGTRGTRRTGRTAASRETSSGWCCEGRWNEEAADAWHWRVGGFQRFGVHGFFWRCGKNIYTNLTVGGFPFSPLELWGKRWSFLHFDVFGPYLFPMVLAQRRNENQLDYYKKQNHVQKLNIDRLE